MATGNVHSHDPPRARLQDALVAVRLGTTLEDSEPRRRGNPSSALVSPRQMAAALRRASRGGRRDRCGSPSGSASTSPRSSATATRRRGRAGADRELAELCRALLDERYARPPAAGAEAEARLEEELATIRKLGLSGFFLLHRELLELAREVALEVRGPARPARSCRRAAGRGSSVSSIVCYLTGLSHIDPVEKDLFSGRFLNDEVDLDARTSTSTSPATSARS